MSSHLYHLLGRTYKRPTLMTQLVRITKATLHSTRQSRVRDATKLVDEMTRRDRYPSHHSSKVIELTILSQSSVSDKTRFCSELSKGRKYLKSYVQRMVRKGEELDKGFWLVDKILSHRRGISEIEYKVKWLGLAELDCTWQPESTMCVPESCQ